MNIDEILKSYVNADGNIESSKLSEAAKAINAAVGSEFVDKKRYDAKLTEIDTLKGEKQAAEDKATTSEKWQVKYDALKTEFDTYKTEVAAKETKSAKSNKYKALLKECGISEKRLDTVIKCSDIDSLELDDKGELKDAEKLTASIKSEWEDFIVSSGTQGAETSTPPFNKGGEVDLDKLSMADYIAQRKKMGI